MALARTTGWSGLARRALLPLVFCVAALASAAPADAASRICRDIERQLAGMGSGGGGSPEARRYGKAISDQRAQMAKVERQMARARCGDAEMTGGSAANACQSLGNTIQRMRKNLASLERAHGRLGGGGSARDRARLVASLDANGCRDEATTASAARRSEAPRRSLFEQIFGGGRVEPMEDFEERPRYPLEEGRTRTVIRPNGPIQIEPQLSGTFRTLCVRTCDGYFFPVSFSTSAVDLDRDASACATMCPGAEVELFLHRTPEEESEQMVSRAGLPYTELPNAFKYRDASFVRPAGCGCNAATKNFSIVAGNPPADPSSLPVPQPPMTPVPVARPDAAADPETLANREGGLDAEVIRRMLAPKPATAAIKPEDRRIRVVGPAFLPDPEGAIDLRAPAQSHVQ